MRCGPPPRYGPGVDDPDGYFGEPVAATYDEESAEMFAAAAVDPVVDLLAGLAGNGRALDLGIGTGRIALPLARRGVPVSGIDLSRAMVNRLRAKRGGAQIDVTIGDFATARAEGRFTLAYLVFNTIVNLTTQDAQVACFGNVAADLWRPAAASWSRFASRSCAGSRPDRSSWRTTSARPVGIRRLQHRHAGDEPELHRIEGDHATTPSSRSGMCCGRPS